MALSLEDAVRRRQLEEALSYLDTGAVPLDTAKADDGASLDEAPSGRDYSANESSLAPKVSKRIKAEYGDWNKWPTVEPAEVPKGHIDLGPPAPAFTIAEDQTGPPVESDILTAPEEQGGGRYVIDKESGRMVPHAELASEADKAEFKPGDVTLPEAVTIGPEVPRAQLVKLPTSFDEPMTPGPSGRQEPVGLKPRPVDILEQLKQQQIAAALPAARAQSVVQPSDIDPGIVRKGETREIDPGIVRQGDTRDIDPGIVRQVAPPGLPPTAPNVPGVHTELAPPGQMDIREDVPSGRTQLPNAPIAQPKPEALPNAPIDQVKPEQLPNAPVGQAKLEPAAKVTGELAKGPPGTSPDGTYDEPYWPKRPEQLSQLPPGAYYIDPLDFSEKKMPGTAPAATPAQRPLSPAQPATSAVPGDASTWDNADGTPAPATKAREEIPTVNPDGTPFPERIQAVGGKDPVAIIIHHTGDHHTAAQTAQVLRDRGLGVELTVDREGNVVQIGEAGAANIKTGWGPKGTGLNNSNIIGIEVAANDDKDVLPVQVQAVKNYLAARYPTTQVFGHGEVNPGHKEADEGMTIVNAIRGGGAAEGNVGDSFQVLDKLSEAGLNATHFGYQGDPNLDPESAQGHGKYVEDMIPGYDVALNAAAAAIVGNPKPGEEFTFGGRTWRYGDKVPELYKDARFDIFDRGNAIFTGGQLGKTAATTQSKEDWESWDVVSPAEMQGARNATAAAVQAQQNVLSALHEHSPNMPSWYHALENPIPGVTDAARNATREIFKQEITKYAQDYYQEPDPNKAFQRIMSAPNLLTSAGEIITKAPAHVQHALLAWSRGLDANGENRIIDFINKVHPEATPEARAGLVREILSKPAGDERTRFVSALYSSVDPQITQGIDLPALLDSIDTISQPGYQEKRKAEINAAVAKNLKDLRTDPTMENTWGGTVSGAIAQMPKNLGEALFPVIGQSAMTSEIYFDTLDGLRKEHPDWSEDQLKAKAGAASVPQVILQEVVNLATMGLGGGLVKGITNPVARIAANSILHGGIAGAAATVQQGVANWATERPVTEGMPQAAIAGGVQGAIGGAMHVPEARPRGALEATTGPKGAPVRGPTEETLAKTAPVTPESVLGPDVPDTSMPWHKPPPIVTRGEERTTFTPAELAEQASTLRGRTPEELTAAAEALQPPMDFSRRGVFLNSDESQRLEIERARAAQEPQRPEAAPPPLPSVGETDPWMSKIANRFTAERMASGELGPVEPGHGVTKEQMASAALRMGPEQINQHISNLMHNAGGDPKLQAAAVRAEEARLAQRSTNASLVSEADPKNQQARIDADNAFKDLTDFHNGPVAKLKNNWHAQGMTLQGEIPLDLSSYNGLREAFLKETGKQPSASMEPVMRKRAKQVRDASAAETAAIKNLGAEIERQSAKRFLPTDEQVRERIMKIMKVEPCPI